jgi:uncharacterized protein (TIGR00255 family)
MTVSGMTGFFRREDTVGAWTWAVEARSVNGRGLEVRIKAPPGFDALEPLVRDAARARFQRGQIAVNVQARRAETTHRPRVNVEALEAYLALGEPLVGPGRAGPPRLDGLLALPGVVEAGCDEDQLEAQAAAQAALAAGAIEALDGLKAARLAEGVELSGLLHGFLDRVETLVAAAEADAALQPALIKERFERRLGELIGEAAPPERIAQEAAALAVKADVREELDRLASHLGAGRALLGGEAAAGRRLDFLTQEMMREAGTLCAKSAAPALTAVGLELKAVIDRFREQAQNVE